MAEIRSGRVRPTACMWGEASGKDHAKEPICLASNAPRLFHALQSIAWLAAQVALQLAAQPRQDAALRSGWLKTYLRPKMRLQYNMEASGPAKWVRWQRMLF